MVLREQRVEQSEISEHSEHSEHSDGLADARSFSRCSALRKRRGAYGCHLPARGGPPTCAGLLLAWWGIGGAVGGRVSALHCSAVRVGGGELLSPG